MKRARTETGAIQNGRRVLPTFASEEEELRFWDTHDPSDYIERPSDVTVRLKHNEGKPVTMGHGESVRERRKTTG
jgi:hypothetical protein